MRLSALGTVADALEALGEIATSANLNEAGQWRRIAVAAEAMAGVFTATNATRSGYMRRTALALETISGTTGAEENVSYTGLLKRIVDALEVMAGAVTAGPLEVRFLVAAQAADLFSPLSLFTGASGGWYDPSDLSTLWQDTAGLTPVTAVGQTVRLIDDKSGNLNEAVTPGATGGVLREDANGKRYIEMTGGCIRAVFVHNQPVDRISAIRQITTGADRRIFSGGGDAQGLLYQDPPQRMTLYSGGVGPFTTSLAIGVNGVVTARFNGASSRIAINNGSYATGNVGANGAAGFALASNDAFPATFNFYGVVSIGRTLTDQEIADTRRFMARKARVVL
jgi:hypothetical protein